MKKLLLLAGLSVVLSGCHAIQVQHVEASSAVHEVRHYHDGTEHVHRYYTNDYDRHYRDHSYRRDAYWDRMTDRERRRCKYLYKRGRPLPEICR
jgi:hypothetical protein